MVVRRMVLLAAMAMVVAALPWLHGQVPSLPPPTQVPGALPLLTPGARKQYDLKRLTPLQQNLYLSAQRGTEWLLRRNKPDGRFVYGFSPSLRQPLEEDSYLAQIEATCALGRAGRFFGNPDAGAVARHALLTLLLNTTTDPQNKRIRYTIPPSAMVNRPAAVGLLLLAICELPTPPEIGKDLLDQADELADFLQSQVRPDGSLSMIETAEEIENFSGPALLGIIRSQKLRPAPWKIEALRKARVVFQAYWRQHKNQAMIAEHSAAFTEAYLLTRERPFADFVFEMNDWLLGQQYQNVDPARQAWTGGFMSWVDGKAAPLPPDVRSALAAQSLAEACRTAQLSAELGRLGRYKESLESCMKFLTTLQYTDANTQHFVEWYRPMLVGGFHASPRDGVLRHRLHATGSWSTCTVS